MNNTRTTARRGVSDIYAATPWMVDYVSHAAQSQISRLYMHQGSGWRYWTWNPVTLFDFDAGVLSIYYWLIFTATELSGGGKQVKLLIEQNHLVAYVVYDEYGLLSLDVVNLEA